MLVQQLAALGQTAEVWQGQVAQYQLDELWMEDGECGRRKDKEEYERNVSKKKKKEIGETNHHTEKKVTVNRTIKN